MAEDHVHVLIALAVGALGAAFFGPLTGIALAIGNLVPDLDEYVNKGYGSSWITHTAVFPSMLAFMYQLVPTLYRFGNLVPAFTLGIIIHVALDFMWYENRKTKEKDVKSSLFGKIPDAAAIAIVILPNLPFLFFGLLR